MKPVIHGSFTIERTYPVPPARVFAAWANIETKARWFIGPGEWKLIKRQLDFRVGGQEVLQGAFGSEPTKFVARYHAIVPNERLIYTYDMHHGEAHLSVALATVELTATAGGTRMVFTEQAAFLDGEDATRSREAGWADHLDRLGTIF